MVLAIAPWESKMLIFFQRSLISSISSLGSGSSPLGAESLKSNQCIYAMCCPLVALPLLPPPGSCLPPAAPLRLLPRKWSQIGWDLDAQHDFYLPHQEACGILVPPPGIEPSPSCVEARLNHHGTTLNSLTSGAPGSQVPEPVTWGRKGLIGRGTKSWSGEILQGV